VFRINKLDEKSRLLGGHSMRAAPSLESLAPALALTGVISGGTAIICTALNNEEPASAADTSTGPDCFRFLTTDLAGSVLPIIPLQKRIIRGVH
jgi:hypothetical protein